MNLILSSLGGLLRVPCLLSRERGAWNRGPLSTEAV
jgi:hypothetical protein